VNLELYLRKFIFVRIDPIEPLTLHKNDIKILDFSKVIYDMKSSGTYEI
jgi:hypothetical protein